MHNLLYLLDHETSAQNIYSVLERLFSHRLLSILAAFDGIVTEALFQKCICCVNNF